MAEDSKIEWCNHTANPWWGCVKVSNGPKGLCTNCYADDLSRRYGHDFANRRKPIKAFWTDIPKWNKKALETGVRPRVFVMSMGDIWEIPPKGHQDYDFLEDARKRALELMEASTGLDFLLLTKRVSNIQKRAPEHWLKGGWPKHIRQGISVGTQPEANLAIPRLLALDCPNFLSMEPLMELVDLTDLKRNESGDVRLNALTGIGKTYHEIGGVMAGLPQRRIQWVIAGGESGSNARPSHPAWFRKLRDDCVVAGVPFHYKQWGEWCGTTMADFDSMFHELQNGESWASGVSDTHWDDGFTSVRVGKKRAGRLLDGRTWDESPYTS